jgi:hypothetical protein
MLLGEIKWISAACPLTPLLKLHYSLVFTVPEREKGHRCRGHCPCSLQQDLRFLGGVGLRARPARRPGKPRTMTRPQATRPASSPGWKAVGSVDAARAGPLTGDQRQRDLGWIHRRVARSCIFSASDQQSTPGMCSVGALGAQRLGTEAEDVVRDKAVHLASARVQQVGLERPRPGLKPLRATA